MAGFKSLLARMEAFDWFLAVFFALCILLGVGYAVFKAHG
jgi:hypothetical protein